MANIRPAMVPAAAAYANVNPSSIWRWLKDGTLTRYRVGINGVRVDLNELDALFAPVAVPAREADAR